MGSDNREKEILKSILTSDMLINLRTYDSHSLVLYANDHNNNFIHLYITNSNEVVYLYNYGDEIVSLTIVYERLNIGTSVQVAVIRNEHSPTMHVNEKNVTIDRGFSLLEDYSKKPWQNPEKEVLSPHRPPSPPTEYFQFNIGGYDPTNLLRTNSAYPELQGYIGCIRGLKIGENLIDLEELMEKNIAHGKKVIHRLKYLQTFYITLNFSTGRCFIGLSDEVRFGTMQKWRNLHGKFCQTRKHL